MDVKKISENIKKFRELKGYTREQFAERLKMSVSGYSKIERGEIDLTVSKLDKISSSLGINPSQLLNFDPTNVFNVVDSNLINNGDGGSINNYMDESTQKYIKILEDENQRLRSFID